jgi:hypothetical protein
MRSFDDPPPFRLTRSYIEALARRVAFCQVAQEFSQPTANQPTIGDF